MTIMRRHEKVQIHRNLEIYAEKNSCENIKDFIKSRNYKIMYNVQKMHMKKCVRFLTFYFVFRKLWLAFLPQLI